MASGYSHARKIVAEMTCHKTIGVGRDEKMVKIPNRITIGEKNKSDDHDNSFSAH
jgi:hypothetical protein